MAEATAADLRDLPTIYKSSRDVYEVLVGEDEALPLMEASSIGDATALKSLLAQPWAKVILESPHTIYYQHRPRGDDADIRNVSAMKILNLHRAALKASQGGHVAAISALLEFASRHGVRANAVIGRHHIILKTIHTRNVDLFRVLAAAEPEVTTRHLHHERYTLWEAVRSNQLEIVEICLQQGAGRAYRHMMSERGLRCPLTTAASRRNGTAMVDLLLSDGFRARGSEALYQAAQIGALDSICLLIENGANVNERASGHFYQRDAVLASRTPMHFAASQGQEDAMKLLQKEGALIDMTDINEETPAQLLKRWKEERDLEANQMRAEGSPE